MAERETLMHHQAGTGEVVFETPEALGRRMATTEDLEYVHLTIRAGGSIAGHALPVAIDFFVVEGSGTASVAGADHDVAVGDLLCVPADTVRSWQNPLAGNLVLLGIKRSAR